VRYGLYVIAAFEVFAGLYAIGTIGKPRKASTPGSAVITVVVVAAIAITLIFAARQIPG
jgi:hypothetical protein